MLLNFKWIKFNHTHSFCEFSVRSQAPQTHAPEVSSLNLFFLCFLEAMWSSYIFNDVNLLLAHNLHLNFEAALTSKGNKKQKKDIKSIRWTLQVTHGTLSYASLQDMADLDKILCM